MSGVKKRDNYWDIVKGIGIVSIVIGHTCPVASPYVYMYHLVIFFFAGAYFYDEKKYGKDPFGYIAKIIKGNYIQYVGYTWLLLLLHNFCVRYALYSGYGYYDLSNIIMWFCNALVFQNPERFAGALWFVPVYMVTMTMLGMVVCFSKKVSELFIRDNNKKRILENVILIFVSFIIGGIGIYYNTLKIEFFYYIHTGFLVFPLCIVAFYVKKLHLDIGKYSKWYLGVFTAIILYFMVYKMEYRIELAQEQIINGYMFYIVSLIGIIFCLCLANVISITKWLSRLFGMLGRYSFSIMALHFFVVKCIDRLYAYIIGEHDKEIIATWVCTYPDKLWLLYVIVGSIVPAMIGYLFDKIKYMVGQKM